MGTNRITKNIAKIVRAYVSRDQVQMAKAIGCSTGTITALECGNWQPQKGKIFDYYDTIFREIPKGDVEILSSNLGLEKKKVVTPKQFKQKKIEAGYRNTSEYQMRFSGEMARFIHEMAKFGMYENPSEYVRDLIRKDRLQHKMKKEIEKKVKTQLAA